MYIRILSLFTFVWILSQCSPAMAQSPIEFVQAICKATKENDDSFLQAHIKHPLVILKRISEGAGNPIHHKKQLTQLAAIKDLLTICDEVSWKRAAVQTLPHRIKVKIPLGQFFAEFTLKPVGHSFLLIFFKG